MRSLLLLLGLLLPAAAAAHQLKALALNLEEYPDGRIQAVLKTGLGQGDQARNAIVTLLPVCESLGTARTEYLGEQMLRYWQMHCEGGLSGRRLQLTGLGPAMPDAVITVRYATGQQQVALLDLRQPWLQFGQMQENPTSLGLAGYFPMGILHILSGIDHLLFVLCLLLVIRARQGGWRSLLTVVTAFTLAHSLTLALSMLAGLQLSAAVVEACIALSILLLAVELARHRMTPEATPGLSLRFPAVVALLFGLLHGFGFAGALSDIGLPEQARGWALLLFNLGVEAGQLLFVTAVLLMMQLPRMLRVNFPGVAQLSARMPVGMVTLLGVISAYWFIDRLQPVLTGWGV